MPLDNDQLLSRYAAEHFERHSISEGRRIVTMRTLTRLAERLGGRTLVELTPSDYMAWQGAEIARGLAPNTVRQRETQVRSFLGWARTAGLISSNLSAELKSVSPVRGATRSKPRPYSRQDIERLRIELHRKFPLVPPRSRRITHLFKGGTGQYAHTRGRLYGPMRRHARRLQFEAQIALALEEGMRSIEIYSATVAEIHHDNRAVLARTAKRKPGEYHLREIPWTEHARGCVREWLEFRYLLRPGHDAPWLALKPTDVLGPMGHERFERALREFDGTGMRFSWHRLRHTFATERLRAGMPLEKLAVMLGHSSPSMTLVYAEIVHSDVQSEAERTEEAFIRNLGLAA